MEGLGEDLLIAKWDATEKGKVSLLTSIVAILHLLRQCKTTLHGIIIQERIHNDYNHTICTTINPNKHLHLEEGVFLMR